MGKRNELGILRAVLAAALLIGSMACGDDDAGGKGAGGSGGDGGTGGIGGTGGDGGDGGTATARLTFLDIYPAISISSDGTVAAIVDDLSGTNVVYFYDVATGALERKTETGDPQRYVNGFSADGRFLAGNRGTPEVPGVWSEATDWIDLPVPSAIGCDALGSSWDVSADGSVAVGMIFTDQCDVLAGRWTRGVDGYTFTQLERMGDENLSGNRATVVSDDGRIAAGFSSGPNGNRTPTLWREDGSGLVLSTDADADGEILAITDDGSMVAGIFGLDGFYWTEASGIVTIGTLPDAGDVPLTLSTAIAAGGNLIFGGSGHRVFGTQRAFVWTAGAGMRPLEEIVRENGLELREGFILSQVLGASTDGSVLVGFASNPETMEWISFVLELPVSAYGL